MSGPVHKEADYPLEVSVWKNESREEGGLPYYNASLQRTYTVDDPATGKKEYKRTGQLRKQDLCAAAELMRLAYHSIRALEEKDRA